MTIRLLQSLVAAVLVFTAASAANANYPNSICRWTGIGWSDGYHSHAACPPRPHAVARQAVAAPAAMPSAMPWWTIPAAGAEQVPTPAAPPPANDSSVVGQGVIRR
ncbi:MAG TPA: hypothetical protein VGI40_14040 [Pirellulaceae bacterium]